MRQDIYDYIKKNYQTLPEYPWRGHDCDAVFRHMDNHKWFALVMNVQKEKLGILGGGSVDVINLKIDDMLFRDQLVQKDGIMPAYHMNKLHWITVLLDGTVETNQVYDLIAVSFMATASAKRKEKIRPPKEWLVPANPKYFDIIHAFDTTDVICWKQGNGIKTGDTVFLYVAAPVSAILYQCDVIETGIPDAYEDENLSIKTQMRLKLQRRYQPDAFTFRILKEEFDIFAVRGLRGIPKRLSEALTDVTIRY